MGTVNRVGIFADPALSTHVVLNTHRRESRKVRARSGLRGRLERKRATPPRPSLHNHVAHETQILEPDLPIYEETAPKSLASCSDRTKIPKGVKVVSFTEYTPPQVSPIYAQVPYEARTFKSVRPIYDEFAPRFLVSLACAASRFCPVSGRESTTSDWSLD